MANFIKSYKELESAFRFKRKNPSYPEYQFKESGKLKFEGENGIFDQARNRFFNRLPLPKDDMEMVEQILKTIDAKEVSLEQYLNPGKTFISEQIPVESLPEQITTGEPATTMTGGSPTLSNAARLPNIPNIPQNIPRTSIPKGPQKVPASAANLGKNIGSSAGIFLKKGGNNLIQGLGGMVGAGGRGLGSFGLRAVNGGLDRWQAASSAAKRFRTPSIRGAGGKAALALLGALFLFMFFSGMLAGIGGPVAPTGEAAPVPGSNVGIGSACDISGFNLFDSNAVTDEVLNKFIEREKNSSLVAKGSNQENLFESRARFIRDTAKAAGLNPAIFLGLWRSESSYSNDRFRRGNDLGCRPDNSEITTFEEDVLCAVGTKSPGKTYEPSYTTKCLLSRDANSSFCQVVKSTAEKEGFTLPINSLDSYLKAYAPLSADPNNINTHRIVKQAITDMGLTKCAPSTSSSTGNLAAVVQWAQKINEALQPGLPPSSYNRMLGDISNGAYTATRRSAQDRGVGPTGIYWCTNIVIDSYNLANIKGLNANHQGVRGMMDFWKKTPEYIFQPYPGTELKLVQPGSALFRINPDWNLDHVSIIKSIEIDHRGEGSIKTLDSNGNKGWTSTIGNNKIFETYFDRATSIVGFGGIAASAGRGGGTTKPVIALDPGHSSSDINVIDPTTGLQDHDYPNIPEIEEVFYVAQQVKNQLEADGYTVVMTKTSANDNVSLRKRADIANNAGASLAVSIHSDHSAKWDDFAQIYVQQTGLYRERSDGQKITFDDAAVAEKSRQHGQILAQERAAAEGRQVSVAGISFNGRPGLAPGNIPLVQLFAKVPWVYNEVGTDGKDRLSQEKLDAYARGITAGIKKSVPK